jgi:hypothetical protein
VGDLVGGHAEGRMEGGPVGVGDMAHAWSGDGHDTGVAAPGRAWERQGKREKGESRGGW